MRISLGLGLAMLIVLVQQNCNGASLSTSKETHKEDEEFARQLGAIEPKNAPSTERNLENPNIPGELENARKNESKDQPIFKAYSFTMIIPDNLPVSSVVGKVEAADPTNQGRKCFYHLTNSTSDLFSVDINTGVITTKKRLDAVDDDAPATISHYVITISTAFHNFTDKSLYDDKFHLKSIQLPMRVHHRPLRDQLFGEQDKKSAPFSLDEVKDWLALISIIANIVIVIGMGIVVAKRSDKWKIKGNDSPPPPTCDQVARNFLKKITKHHCGDNQKETNK